MKINWTDPDQLHALAASSSVEAKRLDAIAKLLPSGRQLEMHTRAMMVNGITEVCLALIESYTFEFTLDDIFHDFESEGEFDSHFRSTFVEHNVHVSFMDSMGMLRDSSMSYSGTKENVRRALLAHFSGNEARMLRYHPEIDQ